MTPGMQLLVVLNVFIMVKSSAQCQPGMRLPHHGKPAAGTQSWETIGPISPL